MEISKTLSVGQSLRTAWIGLAAALMLAFSSGALATAPRIAPQMFGEEKKADILQYRLDSSDAAVATEEKLLAEIVTEAYKAAGMSPRLDMQPSKQLAKYALFNGEVAALVGAPRDFNAKEKKRYRVVVFYLRGGSSAGAEVAMVFSKTHAKGSELYKAFDSGLRKLVASGRYREILAAHHGKDAIAADYFDSLKRLNPGWK